LAAALGLARVLRFSALALARVLALTDVDIGFRGLLRRGRRLLIREGFGARDHAGHDGAHHLAELSAVHSLSPYKIPNCRNGGLRSSYPPFRRPCQDRWACPRQRPNAPGHSPLGARMLRREGHPTARMNPDLERLIRLQRAETDLRRVEAELAEAPRHRAELDAALAAERARLEAARQELAGGQKSRRHHEADLQDLEAKRSRLKGQLMEVKTNKEYTAMLHEIEAVERDIRAREDQI